MLLDESDVVKLLWLLKKDFKIIFFLIFILEIEVVCLFILFLLY
jgi:hypothetical protein